MKHSKSDIYKTWNEIFIRYTDTTKHLSSWAPKTHQVFIASKLVVNKLKRGADFLTENLMLVSSKLLQLLIEEPKPQGKPRKWLCIENIAEQDSFVNNSASMIRTVDPHN